MSGMGEQWRAPFPASSSLQNPSFFLDSHIPHPYRRSAPGCHFAANPYQETAAIDDIVRVRDPPRERLAAFYSQRENEEFPLLPHVTSKSDFGDLAHCEPLLPLQSSSVDFYADIYHYYNDRKRHVVPTFQRVIDPTTKGDAQTMMKKRRSIQAILIPSFLQPSLSVEPSPPTSPTTIVSRMRVLSGSTPTSPYASAFPATVLASGSTDGKHTRQRSRTFSTLSPRSSPPPDFLIDDDPFANLTSAPSETLKGAVPDASPPSLPVPVVIPRSPLYESAPNVHLVPPHASSSTASISSPPSPLPRAIASGRNQARPAHQRPAFKSHPSLPSLHTLSRMNVVLTKKVRKGKVGAGLPFEPWDLPSDEEWTPPTSAPSHQDKPDTSSGSVPTQPPAPNTDTVAFDLAHQHNPSDLPQVAQPQPLLPSQVVALGSIAADVAMVVPVIATPQATPLLSPRHSTSEAAYVLDGVLGRRPMETEFSVYTQSGSMYSEDALSNELHSPTESDESVSDFFERYHQSSRNASEDGHESPLASTPSATTGVPSNHHDGFPEISYSQEFQNEAIETAIPDKPADSEHDADDSERVALADNYHLHSEHASYDTDDQSFAHSDSMLFSSPPSSFSLTRTISSTSRSSYASSNSVGYLEQMEDEGDLAAGLDSLEADRNHSYRQLQNPSLSSLELDMEADPLDDLHMREGVGSSTTRSNSSQPSLTRTRSSSNGSNSDVLYSPTADDYARFPFQTDAHLRIQFPSMHIPPELLPTDRNDVTAEETSSHVVHQSGTPDEGWTDTAKESGFIGAGSFDKIIQSAEGHEATDSREEGESLEGVTAGTSANVLNLTHLTATATNAPDSAAELPLAHSSTYTHTSSPQSPLVLETVQVPSLQLSPDPVEGMPGYFSVDPHPRSVKTETVEPFDASHSYSSSGGRAHVPTSTSRGGQGYNTQTNVSSYHTGYSSTNSRRYGGQGRGNNDDEDEDDQRRRRRALERGHAGETIVKPLFLGDSSEDDTDRYGAALPASISSRENNKRSLPTRSPSRSPATYHSPLLSPGSSSQPATNFPLSNGSSRSTTEDEASEVSEDDDVPLAKAIPGALTAQKTIRRQVREEREEKKRERALRNEGRRERQATIRPSGAGVVGAIDIGSSSSRDAAAMAAAAVASSPVAQNLGRQRTMTLPGNGGNPAVFNPHDLARKLQKVQIPDSSSPPYAAYQSPMPMPMQPSHGLTRQFTHAAQHASPHQAQSPTYLHRAKSFSKPPAEFHQPGDRHHNAASTAASPASRSRSIRSPFTSPVEKQPPLPSLHHMRSFHRPSTERSPSGLDIPRSLGAIEQDPRANYVATPATPARSGHQRSMSLSRRDAERERGPVPAEPVPALPLPMRTSNDEHRRLTKPSPSSTRTSAEGERPPRPSGQLPPLPTAASRNTAVTQQRIFVANLQQFHMVEIGPTTTAGDIVALMDSQGALKGWAGSGGWMVFEIAQDFGMERPIRSYELLADVLASWLKDKTVNYFMLRLTTLAATLARSNIPTMSPTHSGYIEWQAKRGKWSKRWVQLKEHSLWISKRDNGKDEVHLCSLSNFDVYRTTRPHRAPKPFTFTVKSTDKLSLFENTDDYMHTFSCSERDGEIWMEKILIARSYVLHQERHVLFGAAPPTNSTPVNAPLSRSGTRKSPAAHRTPQPFVNLPPFQLGFNQPAPRADVFEPGSLLSKQY